MTNTIYFYNTLRSYFSSSSFSSSVDWSDQTSQHGEAAVAEVAAAAAAASSLYTEAWLACGRSPTQLEHHQEEDDDEASTKFLHAMRQLPAKTGEEESSQKFSYSASKRFSFVELKTATRNFHPDTDLHGNLGSLYKGSLTATKFGTNNAISVIRLDSVGIRDPTESLEKVIRLGHLHHPNLLRLLGYCPEDKNLLVYEFTLRGSLRNLFGGLNFPWSQRLNVALDAAKGLAFIHSSNIVHGCFKSSNILLNSKYSAKLFGLDLPSPATSSLETLETTIGDINYNLYFETVYDAPEYRHTGRCSAESDVYSFGVVLLEILYARPAYQHDGPLAEWDLVRWIKSHGNLESASVDIPCSRKCGEEAVQIALWCLSDHVNFRPKMDQVLEALEKLLMENNRYAL